MFSVGQKVVCVDDKFEGWVAKLYDALPKAGVTYVVRDVRLGIATDCKTGDVSLLLIGLVNPPANSKSALERGFSETRFRPLDEIKGLVNVAPEIRPVGIVFPDEGEAVKELKRALVNEPYYGQA